MKRQLSPWIFSFWLLSLEVLLSGLMHQFINMCLEVPLVCRLLWWQSGKESACQCRRPGFNPWVGKIPWRRKWQPTPVSLLRKSHEQRSWVGYSPWGHKRVRHDWATNTQGRRIQMNSVLLPWTVVDYLVTSLYLFEWLLLAVVCFSLLSASRTPGTDSVWCFWLDYFSSLNSCCFPLIVKHECKTEQSTTWQEF